MVRLTGAQMIVGAVSLWRDGADCIGLNYDIWAVGMADVIVTIVLVCTSWYWLPDFVRDAVWCFACRSRGAAAQRRRVRD